MTEAIIYDHVRTPRARGKPGWPAAHGFDTPFGRDSVESDQGSQRSRSPTDVDDVVMGCVDPVGRQGGDIARMGALAAGFGDTVPGVQINRFCASGLDFSQFRRCSGDERTARADHRRRRRIDEPRRHRRVRRRVAVYPSLAIPAYFMPQGVSADLIATKYGFSRDDVDAYAVEF